MNPTIIKQDLSDVMSPAFLAYALSVIRERALPLLYDGLKPVQRRIIFSMYELGLNPDKAFRKSARVVGDVLGKYHPHGDVSVYEAMVNLAQEFSTRYPIVNGHGNFGSVDGDGAAAMRYTEAKLTRYGQELLKDISKDTVDFEPNFDGMEEEPTVLPGLIPNLLANGSTGIAVGISTDIPPHNLTELYDALIFIIDKALTTGEDATLDEIMKIIKGPDFPTGGTIINQGAIKKIYETGRGSVLIRSKYRIEKNKIYITEIPYQVNKSSLLTEIDSLKRNKYIPEIQTVRDESNKEGISILIELTKGANVDLVLNKLFKKTKLQKSYACNMNAIDSNKVPETYSLIKMLNSFTLHALGIVTRRMKFDLKKFKKRLETLDAILIATHENNVHNIIEIIKNSNKPLEDLIEFGLNEYQAKYVYDMKLSNLTKASKEKYEKEKEELLNSIETYEKTISSETELLLETKKEFILLKEKLGDERLTEICALESKIEDEDLIPDEDLVILYTIDNCIKSVALEEYKTQNRGGKGVKGSNENDECIKTIINACNKDHLLFFTDKGRCIILKAYKILKGTRTAKARSILNYINLENDEKVISIINADSKHQDKFLFFVTKNGIAKKLSVQQLSSSRNSTKVMSFKDEDELIKVLLVDDKDDVVVTTSGGLSLRTNVKNIRAMGRSAAGVIGIKINENDKVVDMTLANDEKMLLTITSNGYGKKSNFSEFQAHNRGGKGMIAHKVTDKTGNVVSVNTVNEQDELLIATNTQLVRVKVDSIPLLNRGTQGVKLISLNKNDNVSSASIIQVEETEVKNNESN